MAGGGGGNGEPLKRPGEKVLKDVTNGLVSVGITKEHGVDHHHMFFKVHEEETQKRRKKLN